MSAHPIIPNIDRSVSSKARSVLAEKLKLFRFCRTDNAECLTKVSYFTFSPSTNGEVLSSPAPENTNDERYSCNTCDAFSVKTGIAVSPQSQREYPPEYLFSKNCLDMKLHDNGELVFEEVFGNTVPIKGDLIAYLPTTTGYARDTKWFICSEQFMKFCTIIQHDNHPSYKTKKGTKSNVFGLKHFLCNGNRLRPSAFRYYVNSRTQNELPLFTEEMNDIFWAQRYEKLSQEYPDIYVALARMCVYGEELCYSNTPTVGLDAPPKADAAGQAQTIQWCVPVEKLVKFLISCGWEVEDSEEKIKSFRGVKPEELVGSDLKKERNNAALKEMYADLKK